MNNICLSILTGIIASLITVLLLEAIKNYKESRFYRKYVGFYDVFLISGKHVDDEIVELKYVGSKLFKVTSFRNGYISWVSSIVMSSGNMFHGEGIYCYASEDDFGLHSILISPERNQISVHFRNLSHRDGIFGGLLWRKKDG